MKSYNKINIVLGADDNYAMPLAVTMYSIMENVNDDAKLQFYILDGGISPKNRKSINRVFRINNIGEKHKICWKDLKVNALNKLPKSGNSQMVYLPFFIPELLSAICKKVIFLDCDLIVKEDITTLWKQDINGWAICAARDVFVQKLANSNGVFDYRVYGGKADSHYFNAGVMIINLKYWSKHNVLQKLVDYLGNHKDSPNLNDEVALNAVLAEQWKELNPLWNQHGSIFWPHVLPKSEFTKRILGMYNELKNHPYVVHFISESKPWSYKCMHPGCSEFLTCLKKCGWFNRLEWKIWWYKYYINRFRWLLQDFFETLNLVNHKSFVQNHKL